MSGLESRSKSKSIVGLEFLEILWRISQVLCFLCKKKKGVFVVNGWLRLRLRLWLWLWLTN